MKLLQPGCGVFAFRDSVKSLDLKVHYFCPPGVAPHTPLVMAMHGVDRVATDVRDAMAAPGERNRQIVLVPEFDARQFPGVASYNFGGAETAPRAMWNFAIIDRLFDHVRSELALSATRFRLFGNSAGAQFVLRYLALMGNARIDGAVASNAGIYMLPDVQQPYPIGMGGLDLTEDHLRRYLAVPLTLLIGSEDNDPNDAHLPRGAGALAQGAHRLARAHWYFAHCRDLARQLGTPFAWRLEVVAGAGHISQAIFDRASACLS